MADAGRQFCDPNKKGNLMQHMRFRRKSLPEGSNIGAPTDLSSPPAVLIPLATIAAELGTDIDRVLDHFGDVVVVNDVGLRCVSAEVCRAHIDSVYTARVAQRDREAKHRAEAAAADSPIKQLRRRLNARALAQRESPAAEAIVVTYNPDGNLR
jgi:hypothetical protein